MIPAKATLNKEFALVSGKYINIQIASLGLLLLLSGCIGLGSNRIEGERFNYNAAIQRTNDEQLLLNLVRLKYRDTPFFMEVNSVASQHTFTTNANANATVPEGALGSFGFGAGAQIQEKPTVTYSPLQGDKFIQRVLSPISLQTITLLYHSGWRVDRLFRLSFQRMNRTRNAPGATGPTPVESPEYEEFRKAVEILHRFQKEDLMTLEFVVEHGVPTLIIRIDPTVKNDPEVLEFSRIIDAEADDGRFYLGPLDDPSYIQIQTRSLLGIMYYLSQGVKAPASDIQKGKVTVTRDSEGKVFDWNAVTENLMTIRSQSELPPDAAAIRVWYRGTWFYIDDSDLNSKSTFSLLAQIFSLQAGKVPSNAPLLTLPIN